MKSIATLFLCTVFSSPVFSQNWTWMHGENAPNQYGVYGMQGLSGPLNTPGGRSAAVTWKDLNGNIWLFGGNGYGSMVNHGRLGDLWKYNVITNEWTWVNGTGLANQPGLYGTIGTPSALTRPGARTGAAGWTDATGNLMLFGGHSGQGSLNDLWKYDIAANQWTWLKGDSTALQPGVYGTQGAASPANKPGSRSASMVWNDGSGNVYLYGGLHSIVSVNCWQNDFYDSGNYYGDLWKYNTATNEWTWLKGDSTVNQPSLYGTKGVFAPANRPGRRAGSASWIDNNGALWMFGGSYQPLACPFFAVQKNDLWKYDPATNQWAWISGDTTTGSTGVYGVKGIASSANKPGSRVPSAFWKDPSGDFWMFGGSGLGVFTGFGAGALNDLWKYDVSAGQWTWMKGDSSTYTSFFYGVQGIPGPFNKPGGRTGSAAFTDNAGNLMFFGGLGATGGGGDNLKDVWHYNLLSNEWTWVKGNKSITKTSTYGSLGVPAATNTPGARQDAATWSGTGNTFWLFGGYGNNSITGPGNLDDLWRYDVATNLWTWMKGDTAFDQKAVYGLKGASGPLNKPGARTGTYEWTDMSGNLWLFGGYGTGASGIMGYLNDLWKYDLATNDWTWIGGDTSKNHTAVYGIQTVSSAANKPGARTGGHTWTDNAGMSWIYGGTGYTGSGLPGGLNDLWKYNPFTNEWTWMKGDTITAQPAWGGMPGDFEAYYTPGSENFIASWKDKQGNFWLYGGTTANVWKYSPVLNQWAKMNWPLPANPSAVFGTKGITAPTNTPGARSGSAYWTDTSGGFWLMGGSRQGLLNDLWHLDRSTGEWAWISGDTIANQPGVYGTKGVSASSNKPGSRTSSASWSDASGNLWIFGGYGYSITVPNPFFASTLGDLWKRDACILPLQPVTITGSLYPCVGTPHTYAVAPVPGATSYTWVFPPGWTGAGNTDTVTATPGTGGMIRVSATNVCGSSSEQMRGVNPMPSPVVQIQHSGNSVYTTGIYVSYQWYFNGTAIAGAIFPNHTAIQDGNYYLVVKNNHGCYGQSNTISVLTGVSSLESKGRISIGPNPTSGTITVSSTDDGSLSIHNAIGQLVHTYAIYEGRNTLQLPVNLSPGVYTASFSTVRSGKKTMLKIVYQP